MKKMILRFEYSWYLIRIEGIMNKEMVAYKMKDTGKKHHKIHIIKITDKQGTKFYEPTARNIKKNRKVIGHFVGQREKPFFLGPESRSDANNTIKEVYKLKRFI